MKTGALVLALTALLAGTAAPDVTALASRAQSLLHSQRPFRKAVLLEADGILAAGTRWVTTAGGIGKWRFVFDNQETGGMYKSATVLAVRGHLGKVRGNTQPFLEDQAIRPIPTMTLTRAIELLDKSGGGTWQFSAVTLRKPLYPGVKHAEYIFAIRSGKNIAVDTVTGKVKPLS